MIIQAIQSSMPNGKPQYNQSRERLNAAAVAATAEQFAAALLMETVVRFYIKVIKCGSRCGCRTGCIRWKQRFYYSGF